MTNLVMDNCPVNYATFRWLGCKLSRTYEDLDTATDIKNTMGKYVLAVFDPPHLAKLGCFRQITMVYIYFQTTLQGNLIKGQQHENLVFYFTLITSKFH